MDPTQPLPPRTEWLDPISIRRPQTVLTPLLVASPHSGIAYPASFLRQSRLDLFTLRQSEDAFVDHLVSDVPDIGGQLLCALFPRVYCDVNRAAWELDPTMFTERLPTEAITDTAKVRSGLGMIARIVGGQNIYRERLDIEDARHRIATCWAPYHNALMALFDETVRRFGGGILLDVHSMPELTHRSTPDIVLGDAHGTASAPSIMGFLESEFRMRGYQVARNNPYAGAYITRTYGRPEANRHTVQIEIARRLYMNENTIEPHAGMAKLRQDLRVIMGRLASALPFSRLETPLQENPPRH